MKLLVAPTTKDLKTLKNLKADAFLFGLKGFTSHNELNLSISDIKELTNKLSEEIFILINKIFYNDELEALTKVLKELATINIKGLIFYDMAILNINTDLSLNLPLVMGKDFFATNYRSFDFYLEKGVKTSLISSEITLEEIKEMRKNTKMELIVPLFGYQQVMTSKRHLVSNYFNYFKKENKHTSYYLKEDKKEDLFLINEDCNGTYIYTSHILDGLAESLELQDFEYGYINGYNIDQDIFQSVIDLFKTINNDNKEKKIEALNNLKFPLSKGFFYQKTIYRVKS